MYVKSNEELKRPRVIPTSEMKLKIIVDFETDK
jgi:hypothetical protein